jgi:hypothetical protein
MEGGQTIDYYSTEWAKNHQNDIQADLTLLSNTDSHFLHNQLSFSTQWYDSHTVITGSTPNDMNGSNSPLLLKNTFQYKMPLGDNVFTLSANAGLYSRPQNLSVTKEREGTFRQEISSYSAFAEAGAVLDRRINDRFTFSLNAGLSGNIRQLKAEMKELADFMLPDVKSGYNVFNAFGGVSLTYIADHLQGTFKLPLDYGYYSLKDKKEHTEKHKSKYYLSPQLSLTYIPFDFLSLNFEGAIYNDEHPRLNVYKGMVFSDFRIAYEGYTGFNGTQSINGKLTASFSWPKSSFFLNAGVSYWGNQDYFGEVMELDNEYLVNKYTDDRGDDQWYEASIDISKGIESFKGMVGIRINGSIHDTDVERNQVTLPFKQHTLSISPYINGRLNSWWNVIYKLQYQIHSTNMDDKSVTYHYQDYNHTLEMIFSPWNKLNFSVLGEHYHTEYTGLTKNLVLFDCKVEYNLTNNLQLILSAKNILNQKNYNLTLDDDEMLAKSFSSYQIRPRNILLSLYYKF